MSDEIERGRLAREVLDNPVFIAAMAQIQAEVVSQWQNEKNPKDREWLWSMNQACKRFQQVLTQTVASGEFKAQKIEQERSRLARLGRTLTGR